MLRWNSEMDVIAECQVSVNATIKRLLNAKQITAELPLLWSFVVLLACVHIVQHTVDTVLMNCR